MSPQIKYTPLHWLAYWNDVGSIMLIFETFDSKPEKQFHEFQIMMTVGGKGLTPIDIAAKNKSHEAAILLLDQFIKRKDLIANIYQINSKVEVEKV